MILLAKIALSCTFFNNYVSARSEIRNLRISKMSHYICLGISYSYYGGMIENLSSTTKKP